MQQKIPGYRLKEKLINSKIYYETSDFPFFDNNLYAWPPGTG